MIGPGFDEAMPEHAIPFHGGVVRVPRIRKSKPAVPNALLQWLLQIRAVDAESVSGIRRRDDDRQRLLTRPIAQRREAILGGIVGPESREADRQIGRERLENRRIVVGGDELRHTVLDDIGQPVRPNLDRLDQIVAGKPLRVDRVDSRACWGGLAGRQPVRHARPHRPAVGLRIDRQETARTPGSSVVVTRASLGGVEALPPAVEMRSRLHEPAMVVAVDKLLALPSQAVDRPGKAG